MHKHVGDELGCVKRVGKHEMQTEKILQPDAVALGYDRAEKHQGIDDQQVFCYGRDIIHVVKRLSIHHTFFCVQRYVLYSVRA